MHVDISTQRIRILRRMHNIRRNSQVRSSALSSKNEERGADSAHPPSDLSFIARCREARFYREFNPRFRDRKNSGIYAAARFQPPRDSKLPGSDTKCLVFGEARKIWTRKREGSHDGHESREIGSWNRTRFRLPLSGESVYPQRFS